MRAVLVLLVFSLCVPICAAGQWRELMLMDVAGSPGVYASSRLEEGDDWRKYAEVNLFDGSRDTAWVEGAAGDGIGERVWFAVDPGINDLTITNGYARSTSLFQKNNRVKRLEASLWYGVSGEKMLTEIGRLYQAVPVFPAVSLAVADSAAPQRLALAFDWRRQAIDGEAIADRYRADFKIPADWGTLSRWILCLEIKEVYRGTAYRDTCIAEVSWTLPRQVAGPGGTRAADLLGAWTTEKGAEWELLRLTEEEGVRLYETFLGERPYDYGTWSVGDGKLVLSSDAGDSRGYGSGSLAGGKLRLVAEDGHEELYVRAPEE
jgi:hypothetical protein